MGMERQMGGGAILRWQKLNGYSMTYVRMAIDIDEDIISSGWLPEIVCLPGTGEQKAHFFLSNILASNGREGLFQFKPDCLPH